MFSSKRLLCVIAGMVLSTAASAQIYESKDAKGNTVFSDKPSQGAEEVKLSPINTAVPPPDFPTLAPKVTNDPDPSRPRSVRRIDDDAHSDDEEHKYEEDDYYYYGGYDRDNEAVEDRRERREIRQERRENRPHAEPRRSGSPAGGGLRGR